MNFLSYQLRLQNVFMHYNALEIFIFITGIRFYKRIKEHRLEFILLLTVLFFVLDIAAGVYQMNNWHNIHFQNLYYLLATPLCLTLFFKVLSPKNHWKVFYIASGILICILTLIEFSLNEHPKSVMNLMTAIFFHLSNIILAGLSIYKLIDSPSTISLYYEPHFWILAGFMVDGIFRSVYYASHPYLVTHIEQLRHFMFFPKLICASRVFFDLSILISFLLSASMRLTEANFQVTANTSDPDVSSN
jgi:hypothetical protein